MDPNQAPTPLQQPGQNISPYSGPEPQPSGQPGFQEPVQPPAPNRSKRTIMTIAIILLLLAIGAAVFWYLGKDDSESPSSTDTTAQNQEQAVEQPSEAELMTTTFTSGLAAKSTASVEHPSDWEVATDSEELDDGLTLNHTVIGSPSGHYLHLFDVSGIGGSCDPDDDPYTLVKKLATRTPNAYFTEYKAEGISQVLRIEDLGNQYKSEAHKQLKEGESGTGVCNNEIGFYSQYGGVFATITDSKDRQNLGSNLSYEDIDEDTEFVKMLESLVIVDKSVE